MKTLKCDLCTHEAQGENFEEWMNALKPHYMTAHADVMAKHAGNLEEMKAQMGAWMEENRTRFEAA
jgi:glycerol-3-phosphate cytidylyltransferase-like family protein